MASKGAAPGNRRWGPAITFHPYDQNYPLVFQSARDSIKQIIPEAVVEHVGSTSVPGLGGRKVVDIVVVAENKDISVYHEKILTLGYKDFPYAYVKPMMNAAIDYNGVEYSVMLYILPIDHEYVRGWIAFRNYMTKHPEEIVQYEQVKKNALSIDKSDPRGYQESKTPFLEGLSKRIASSALSH